MQFTYSHHLVQLVARAEAATTRIAGADPDRRARLAPAARGEAAACSARLDGSPLTDETVARVDAGDVPVLDGPPADLGTGWARALRLEGMETQDVAAVEYANLRTLDAVEAELASRIVTEPLTALRDVHGIVCEGLVDPAVIGAPRRTEQAVHDGAQGMVIYHAPAPDTVEPALADLDEWLRRRTLVQHPAITAGLVHGRLLEIQPFEAGNGRVARACARLVLVAAGVDPQGVAVLERQLMADPTGYYGEVAATVRRRGDRSRWLERHTGALARALEAAADALDPRPRPALPDRGRAVVAAVPAGGRINLREYARDVGVDLRDARADLVAFARAGELVEAAGGGGLTFERPRSMA
ncbi:Fic family protein [Euzebya sp.]|uniref:Fic family protein n=1 Tax=Euzebya sp. TaxID=1971409 RepID=UPI0035130153